MIQTNFSFLDLQYEKPDVEILKTAINNLIFELKNSENSNQIIEIIDTFNALSNNFQTMHALSQVRNSLDTNDIFYTNEVQFFNENSPEIEALSTLFIKELVIVPFLEDLSEKYGKHYIELLKVKVKTIDSIIIDLLKKENALTFEYNQLLGKAKFDFMGMTHNLSSLVPLMSSLDRTIRKDANKMYWSFYEANLDQFRGIYDQLVALRHEMAIKMGYQNFIQMGYDRMERTDYTYKEIQEFRKNILELAVPLFKKLKKDQEERLGLCDYKYYDANIQFKTGNPLPKGDVETLVGVAKEMYAELDNNTSEFFNMMIDEKLMDLDTRSGKQPGGYCTSFNNYKKPFIFANFNKTAHDVVVLTHEAGHAFQYYMSAQNVVSPTLQWSTAELAEVHSMSMESLTLPWMENFFKEDTVKFKYDHAVSAFSLLIRCCVLDEFQEEVYSNPTLTPQKREDLYKVISKKYGSDADYDGVLILENGGAWYRVMHLFFGPFYYIDYALAQICAFQFQKLSEDNKELALEKYVDLCKMGGSDNFTNTLQKINLNNPFKSNTLKDIVSYVEKYLNQFDVKNL